MSDRPDGKGEGRQKAKKVTPGTTHSQNQQKKKSPPPSLKKKSKEK